VVNMHLSATGALVGQAIPTAVAGGGGNPLPYLFRNVGAHVGKGSVVCQEEFATTQAEEGIGTRFAQRNSTVFLTQGLQGFSLLGS